MDMFKKILGSKTLRFIFTAILIYLAFRKVDVRHLAVEIAMVPKWFLGLMVVYYFLSTFLGGVRWSYLILDKPKFGDFWNFTRSSYLGAFYSLVFPTMVAGDLLKWLPLLEKYPNLSKTKLATSVLIDRVVGFSAFTVVGWLALMAGKILKYQFPDYLLILFSGLALGIILFYVLVFTIDFDKIFGSLSTKYKLINKLLEIMDLLKNENKKRILICFFISLVGEPVWIIPVWFFSLIFGAGVSLLQVFIFVPIVSLILVLPISMAGFGARETLYLFFFGQLGFADEKVLLISTFGGLMSILNALLGGLLMLIK